MWPLRLTVAMTLTLNFQGQVWTLLYPSQKWSDCHKMKNKYIDWTLGLKYDQWDWPWPWPSHWIMKVKYGICWCKDLLDSDQGDFRCQRAINSSSLPSWCAMEHLSIVSTLWEKIDRYLGTILPTWINFNLRIDTSIINCVMKLLSHSWTSVPVKPLKFENG